jgi:hypothetical protein
MNMFRRGRALAATIPLLAGSACVSIHAPSFMEPAPKREWPTTLSMAQFRVSEGKFDLADSVLAQFATKYPGSREALESIYWRALVRMDPSNPHGSVSDALASLETYVTDARSPDHMREAAALRRVALQLDTLNKLVATAAALPKDGNLVTANIRPQPTVDLAKPIIDPVPYADAEIKRLRDELAKANAELERIRKRLAQPPRGPP